MKAGILTNEARNTRTELVACSNCEIRRNSNKLKEFKKDDKKQLL